MMSGGGTSADNCLLGGTTQKRLGTATLYNVWLIWDLLYILAGLYPYHGQSPQRIE